MCILGPRGDLFTEDATELSVDEYGFTVEPESSFFGGKLKKDQKSKSIETDGVFKLWGRLFYQVKRDTIIDYDKTGYEPQYFSKLRKD